MSASLDSPRWRRVRATVRDIGLLFREFQGPLLVFLGAIGGGGLLYHALANLAGEAIDSRAAAFYHVLGLVFLSPSESFPHAWYLQIFYFLMPILGIGILAQGITDFGTLLFNRRARGKEWEMALASTFRNHVVLVGLGHLGYRVAHHLHSMQQNVVVVDNHPQVDLVSTIRDLGIPVIVDDATREEILVAARIVDAKAIVMATQQDGTNLQIAMKARDLNPDIQVVLRIFDDDFAHALKKQFGFQAISTSATASPLFASAAAGVDMTRPITVEGQALSLASISVSAKSSLVDRTVEAIERDFKVSVVLLRNTESEFHPSPDRRVLRGDCLGILGGPKEISDVAQSNKG
jgi:Trk K+ transport system NAD-binding subunit